MEWFRFYHDVVNDPKVQRLTPALFKHWVNCICLASSNDNRGTIPPVADVAFALRIKPGAAQAIIDNLISEGLFDRAENGVVSVHGWEQRQRQSDDVASRVRKHRVKST